MRLSNKRNNSNFAKTSIREFFQNHNAKVLNECYLSRLSQHLNWMNRSEYYLHRKKRITWSEFLVKFPNEKNVNLKVALGTLLSLLKYAIVNAWNYFLLCTNFYSIPIPKKTFASHMRHYLKTALIYFYFIQSIRILEK